MSGNGYGFCKEIENEISRRKSRNSRVLQARKAGLKAGHPEVYSAYRELMEVSLDLAEKIAVSAENTDQLKALAEKLTAEKEAELKAALTAERLPEDYLKPQYTCKICHDTGMVDGEVCACMRRMLIESRFKGSGINREQTFKTFRHDLFSDARDRRASEAVCSYCIEYAERFPENELPDLLLMGIPGVGKTFLLNCIGARLLERGYSVLKISSYKLIESTLDSIRNSGNGRQDMTMPDVLMIDDLGAEPMISNITVETVLSILCDRQDAGKATLIATNKDIDSLQEEYGQRIFSRMISPQRVKIFTIMTPSIRTMKIKS